MLRFMRMFGSHCRDGNRREEDQVPETGTDSYFVRPQKKTFIAVGIHFFRSPEPVEEGSSVTHESLLQPPRGTVVRHSGLDRHPYVCSDDGPGLLPLTFPPLTF